MNSLNLASLFWTSETYLAISTLGCLWAYATLAKVAAFICFATPVLGSDMARKLPHCPLSPRAQSLAVRNLRSVSLNFLARAEASLKQTAEFRGSSPACLTTADIRPTTVSSGGGVKLSPSVLSSLADSLSSSSSSSHLSFQPVPGFRAKIFLHSSSFFSGSPPIALSSRYSFNTVLPASTTSPALTSMAFTSFLSPSPAMTFTIPLIDLGNSASPM
mmetsp:Transcript_8795/g.17646  ORF Transcript_8795/g.17646 Transcript_8795/m.17646 type:complete len:217 (+) Transcript_8795:171-821(+)